jgi:hypothetical protein
MKSYFCSQQERVTAAIQAGHWPEGCDPELRAHVEICETCSDAALVAQSLRRARHAAIAIHAPQLPSPGLLWWRAQIRRRNADLERMTRPIAVAEKIALLLVLVATAAMVAWLYRPLASWFSNIWAPFSTLGQVPGLLMLAAGSLAVFGGFAVYLLKAKE